jgi:hypothetical protein
VASIHKDVNHIQQVFAKDIPEIILRTAVVLNIVFALDIKKIGIIYTSN